MRRNSNTGSYNSWKIVRLKMTMTRRYCIRNWKHWKLSSLRWKVLKRSIMRSWGKIGLWLRKEPILNDNFRKPSRIKIAVFLISAGNSRTNSSTTSVSTETRMRKSRIWATKWWKLRGNLISVEVNRTKSEEITSPPSRKQQTPNRKRNQPRKLLKWKSRKFYQWRQNMQQWSKSWKA